MKKGYAICFNEWALDKSIKSELGLLLIISSLTAEKGYCYASNSYFSKLFDIDQVSVSRKIKKLEQKGYVKIDYEYRGSEVVNREIRLTKMLTDHIQKSQSTINKNVKDNSTSNNNTSIKRERENPAQKNSETEWDGQVNLNIPSLKDRQREQQKDAYATTTAIDFLRNNYPSRYEQQFKMKFSAKIKDQQHFISTFNDTVDIEGLTYNPRTLFARLNKYATYWVKNQGKFSNKPKGGKTGML